MVNSRDIARLANVSQSSVSRALRGDPQISEATRNRIRKIALDHGYVPSDAGRSLATGTTGRIGIVVSDMSSPYYAQLIELLHAELAKAGYAAMILASDHDGPKTLDRVIGRSVDGLIMLVNSNRLDGENGSTPPMVWLNSDPGDGAGDWCMLDNEAAGRLVARELLDLGHRRIGLIFPQASPTERQRERGFRNELKTAGISVPKNLVFRRLTDFQTGYDGLQKLMSTAEPPTAIFCYSDILAIGAINAARHEGIDLPGDLSIVGVGNVPMGAWDVLRLTSVAYDLQSLVHWAVALLTERITSPDGASIPHRRLLFTPTLVRRSSHGEPRKG